MVMLRPCEPAEAKDTYETLELVVGLDRLDNHVECILGWTCV